MHAGHMKCYLVSSTMCESIRSLLPSRPRVYVFYVVNKNYFAGKFVDVATYDLRLCHENDGNDYNYSTYMNEIYVGASSAATKLAVSYLSI